MLNVSSHRKWMVAQKIPALVKLEILMLESYLLKSKVCQEKMAKAQKAGKRMG